MVGRLVSASLPVAFGYVPLGMAFGVLLADLGYPWWWATVMSLMIYAGSAQFLAVSLLAAGAGLVEAFVSTLLLNLRHVFYGLTVLDRYRSLGPGRWYATFGLTDETFSLVAASEATPADRRWVPALTAVNQAWWVLGSTLGAVLGQDLPFSTEGLTFSLTALFAVLLVEQLPRVDQPLALVGALASAVVVGILLPPQAFLITAIALAATVLVLLPAPRRLR